MLLVYLCIVAKIIIMMGICLKIFPNVNFFPSLNENCQTKLLMFNYITGTEFWKDDVLCNFGSLMQFQVLHVSVDHVFPHTISDTIAKW